MLKRLALVWISCGLIEALSADFAASAEMLIEAEGFRQCGGWVVDPQFLEVMGSPYLLAHGLGDPVASARTVITTPEAGRYQIWVRTKDWVPSHHPGTFQISVAGERLPTVYGNHGQDWSWQKGDVVDLPQGDSELELHDLTGFDGRCDAIYLTTDLSDSSPPSASTELATWRRRLLGLPEIPPTAGTFGVVVVGGGVAGCSAALAAARLGADVALIQNRPVLGGNASPEIGITPRGKLRSIVNEFVEAGRDRVLRREPTVKLFLGWHAIRVQMDGNTIAAVDAQNTFDNQERRFEAPVFIDCSGVGAIGYLAGAEYRMGREARSEFQESLAPEKADTMHHGNTVVFGTAMADHPIPFPDVPWARAVAGDYAELGGQVVDGRDNIDGLTHFWEYGQYLDPFREAEHIRDHMFCAIYGTFANVKQRYPRAAAKLKLQWVGHVPAGGESRRLIGDYILTENDIRAQRSFPDSVAQCTGNFCLHFPGDEYDFRLGDWKYVPTQPYTIPFRCLYSRNVDNLMMAGKHASVSHIAGSSTKIMLNGGQMGVAVGAAAFLCDKYQTLPRGIYRDHLAELQAILAERGTYANCFQRGNGGPASPATDQ